jgi:tetratricopeptide (TPR) repeat protein
MPAEIGLAQAYRGVRNFEEAKQTLERSAREHPRAAEPLAKMGDMEIQLQTYDSAITHLKDAVRLAPANTANRDLLAAAYKAKGDADNALAELRKVLARDPSNALALYLQAEIYADRNQDAPALAGARKVVELQPKNPRGRVLLGKILLRTLQGESPADAKKRCNDAVAALLPVATGPATDSETLFLLSRAYRCAGQAEQADKTVAAFEAASQNDRTAKENETQARHLVQQANDAALKNDRAGAIDLVQQALAKNPNDGAAYSLLAKIYYSSGKIDDASDAITKALERDPHHPDFLYVQGKILQKQGKLDEALTAFLRTTLVNPKEADAFFEIGSIYQQRNDRPRALSAYKKALDLSPDDPDYRRALASISPAAASKP